MTDISILLQYVNDGKQIEKQFGTFSELKQTAVSFFNIQKLKETF